MARRPNALALPGDSSLVERFDLARSRGRIALLDPGGQQTSCAIIVWGEENAGAAGKSGKPVVASVRSVPTRGYAAGEVTDMEAFVRCVRTAFDAAEGAAGRGRVNDLVIAVGGGSVGSRYGRGDTRVSGSVVDDRDMVRAMRRCERPEQSATEVLLHAFPVHYSLDDRDGIFDPRGLVGRRLTVDMVWVLARHAALADLGRCAQHCGLSAVGYVARPYAAGLGSIGAADNGQLPQGYACVEIGTNTTGVSVFFRGRCLFAGGMAQGLADIAARVAAETGGQIDEHGAIHAPVGTSAKAMARTLQRESFSHFSAVRRLLVQAEFFEIPGRRAELVGYGARHPGIREAASRALGCPLTVGRPSGVWWPQEQATDPAFATLIGLAHFAHAPAVERWDHERVFAIGVSSAAKRTFRWMAEAW